VIHTAYDHGDDQPATDLTPAQLRGAVADPAGIVWVDIEAAPKDVALEVLDGVFHFHPLTIDDCLGDEQRPKIDDFDDYVFVITHAATRDDAGVPQRETSEFDLFLGPNYVVTFHSQPVPAATALHELAQRDIRVLNRGADRLAAEILAALAADFLTVLDGADDELEAIEAEVFDRPGRQTATRLFRVRHDLASLRRAVAPQRELLNRLSWDAFKPIRPETRVYFREAYDRIVRVLDQVENLRDLAAGALDTYLSVTSNRLNQTMRWLAAVSTIFLPLTLIASIYGMNFPDLPALRQPGAWAVVIGIMLLISGGLILYFRRQDWL
jgi:magnesium transporter